MEPHDLLAAHVRRSYWISLNIDRFTAILLAFDRLTACNQNSRITKQQATRDNMTIIESRGKNGICSSFL